MYVCVCVCVWYVCGFFSWGARKSRACFCCGEMVRRRRRRRTSRRRSLWRNGKKQKEREKKKFGEFSVLTFVGCFAAGVRCS